MKAIKEHDGGNDGGNTAFGVSEVFRVKEIFHEGRRESSRKVHMDSSTAFGHEKWLYRHHLSDSSTKFEHE